MVRKVAQFWLLLVFIILALGLQYYTEVQSLEITDNAKKITVGVPLLEQTYTMHLFVYTLSVFLLAAALACVHFGFDSFRKGMKVRRLEKRLAEMNQHSTRSPTYGSSTDLDTQV